MSFISLVRLRDPTSKAIDPPQMPNNTHQTKKIHYSNLNPKTKEKNWKTKNKINFFFREKIKSN